MYCATAGTLDLLTVNEPYPSCHPNRLPEPNKPLSFMNFDDPPFNRFMTSETASVLGMRIST